jgi:hypothetical protein
VTVAALFALGQVATPSALQDFGPVLIAELLQRHLALDTVTDVSATLDTVSDVQRLVGTPTAFYRMLSATSSSSQRVL